MWDNQKTNKKNLKQKFTLSMACGSIKNKKQT